MPSVRLPEGTIEYSESGSGEPIVFVHGFLVNSRLWTKVVPGLERDFRCVLPEFPLGSHPHAMEPRADLTPTGLASIVAGFLEALDLQNVTLVGNDSGGAISQIVATEHPERIGRLVLTPCDAFENFPPAMFRYLKLAARFPVVMGLLTQSMRLNAVRRSPAAFGWLSKRPIERELLDAWVQPGLNDRAIARDAVKIIRGIDKRYTLEAARKLASFDRPALIAWAADDRFFKREHGERLAATIPDARFELIQDSRTFVSIDQPEKLAELIAAFVREPQREPARAG